MQPMANAPEASSALNTSENTGLFTVHVKDAINGKVLELPVGPMTTVADLKAQIEAQLGASHPRAAQQLIFSGAALADQNSMQSSAVVPGTTLFLVTRRQHPTVTPAPAPRVEAAVPQAPPAYTELASTPGGNGVETAGQGEGVTL